MKSPLDRRRFLRLAAEGAAGAALVRGPFVRSGRQDPGRPVRLGVIGFGVQGLNDANAARRVSNVLVTAAASCYDGHLERARELLGHDALVTRDYRRILDRRDIDAVIVATPDHWHSRVCLDALEAGKDVYCEKPLTHTVEEGEALVSAVQTSGRIFQVGSQHTSSPHVIEARELIAAGALGDVTQVKASWDTNNEISAWVKPIPPDASEATIDWERFQGPAPRGPFDPRRVFRWRTYREYGEGLAGDVLVHIITAIHYLLNLDVPAVGTAVGGRLRWKDDRNVYDTITGGWEYPEGIVSVLGATQNNAHDGTGIRILGAKATMILTFSDYTIVEDESPPNWRYTTNVWPRAHREEYWTSKGLPLEAPPQGPQPAREPKIVRRSEPDTSGRRVPWHMQHFIDCVREGRQPIQDVVMGNNAAITAHMANLAYDGRRAVYFDRRRRRMVDEPPPRETE